MPDPILEAIDLCRRASDGTWLARAVNLTINTGDRIGIVGASGSGKTVLLRALAALDSIQSGKLLFERNTIRSTTVPLFRTRVAYQHQSPTLFDGNVETNLRRPFELAVHANRSFDRNRAVAWLELLNRDESFLRKDQQTLSGGKRQLTSLLRTLQLDPQVLLLDEPTSALDAKSVQSVESLINDWLRENPKAAFVWVSHDAAQLQRMCSRIHHMSHGQLKDP